MLNTTPADRTKSQNGLDPQIGSHFPACLRYPSKAHQYIDHLIPWNYRLILLISIGFSLRFAMQDGNLNSRFPNPFVWPFAMNGNPASDPTPQIISQVDRVGTHSAVEYPTRSTESGSGANPLEPFIRSRGSGTVIHRGVGRPGSLKCTKCRTSKVRVRQVPCDNTDAKCEYEDIWHPCKRCIERFPEDCGPKSLPIKQRIFAETQSLSKDDSYWFRVSFIQRLPSQLRMEGRIQNPAPLMSTFWPEIPVFSEPCRLSLLAYAASLMADDPEKIDSSIYLDEYIRCTRALDKDSVSHWEIAISAFNLMRQSDVMMQRTDNRNERAFQDMNDFFGALTTHFIALCSKIACLKEQSQKGLLYGPSESDVDNLNLLSKR
jgi:hypothetical protein